MKDPATTAATDLVLAALAAAGVVLARRPLWRPLFLLLAAGSLLGAAIHGLDLGARATWWLWLPLNLLLGLALALLVAAAGFRHALPLLLPLGLAVGAVAQAFPDTFLPIVACEALALSVAGASWLRQHRRTLALGCLAALLAGGVQAAGWSARWVWEFDHNGLFHLAQIPAMLLWIAGARRPDAA